MASIFASIGRTAKRTAEDDNKTPKDRKDDDEAEKARKAKKKSKADDDDDEEGAEDDKKDSDDPKAAATRATERARVRAILTSGPGLANPVVAAHVALDTSMPRTKAITVIETLNAATGVPEFDQDEGDASGSMAAAIIAAGNKARGETAPLPPGQRERMSVRPEARSAQPRRDMAAEILAAGRKARGED